MRRFSKALLREEIEMRLTSLNLRFVEAHPRRKCIDPSDGYVQCLNLPALMWIHGQWVALRDLLQEVDP